MNTVVFMGSSEFSVPILEMLYSNYDLLGVITQADKKAGRGNQLRMTPVRQYCLENNIKNIQISSLKTNTILYILNKWNPEIIIVAAFGLILPQTVLELPVKGCLNVHASLLPRWRGATPIQTAILNGDKISGVTIIKMDTGIDTGPILAQSSTPLFGDETCKDLLKKLSILGANLLLDTLPKYLKSEIQPTEQNEKYASYAKIFHKEDGLIKFSDSIKTIENKVRAYYPWPGTYIYWRSKRIKLIKISTFKDKLLNPGKFGDIKGFPMFGAIDGIVLIEELQLEGKKPMKGDEFLRGVKDWSA